MYQCNNGSCVRVEVIGGGNVMMSDSKDPGGPILVFTASEWAAFTSGVKAGEFDLGTLASHG